MRSPKVVGGRAVGEAGLAHRPDAVMGTPVGGSGSRHTLLLPFLIFSPKCRLRLESDLLNRPVLLEL